MATEIMRKALEMQTAREPGEDITSPNSPVLLDLQVLVSSRPDSALRLERENSEVRTGQQ